MVRVILLLSLLVAAACCSSANDGAESWLLAGGNRAVPDCVTRHAPLVWLHSEDPFRPSDLLQHVHHTRPTVDQSPIAGLPKLSLDNLETLNRVKTGQVALTSKDDVTTLPAWILGKVPDESGRTVNATPCVVVAVERGPQDLDAFYFYFYSYNRGANLTQVMEPVNRLIQDVEHGMHFGDHVGDWEHNMIRFRDGQPTGIYYSQHSGGAAYGWHDEGISLEDERPVVFSAYGSHANYPSPGNHIHDEALIDYCDAGKLWDPVLSAYFYHYHPATSTFTRLLPAGSAVPPTGNLGSFLHYTGLWGDARYPDDHPLQRTVPLFGLKRFVSGPLGPMAKQLVRGGLSPDSRGSKSWTQRLVGILMSWYPCCLRGWRKWLSGAVVAALLVLSMMGLGHGVKRYRARKGYKKMEADIPLGDIDPPGRVAWRGDGEA